MNIKVEFPTEQEVEYLTKQHISNNPGLSDFEAQEEVLRELSDIPIKMH